MTQRDRRRGLGAALTAAVVGISLAAMPGTAVADPTTPPENPAVDLGTHDRELIAEARAAGKRTVEILVATERGAASSGVAQLTDAGAKIRYRADQIGYVRAEVPIDSVEKMAALSDVVSLDVDHVVELDDPRPLGIQDPVAQPAPGPNTPRVNPYMPTGETGAAQFVEANPKFDGRGVTVGIIDSGVDLSHPSLNTTSTGEKKIVDWVTGTNPGFNSAGVNLENDPTWINMKNPAAAGIATPKAAADYRYGVFNERDPRLGGEVGNDVNRDGNPAGSIGTFGVLWDPATNNVWVDTNQNKNFNDDRAMTDYKVRQDVGAFGTDNPATPLNESMPFVVQTSPATQSVNIGISSGAHGSHVAGIVAGNKLFGGNINGAAPGAKLVSVRACMFTAGCTTHALTEGMIYAVAEAGVDVINMSIGGLDLVNEGVTARELLYNRLIDEYGVQMFLSAGNDGAGLNTVSQPSLGNKIMSIGSYISRASWQRNYGSDAAQEDNLHPFSARGPREDGGFKPNVVAPGSAVSTTPTWAAGAPTPGTYALPPGYGMLQGTSMASPQAAGVGALLVSAAQQKNVQHAPAQIRQALNSTARFLSNYQAYEQGMGLIDVKKAWNMLKANIETTDISSSVPVNTVLSSFLSKPGIGTGIYDREGVKAGDSFVREYTFTRNSGPANAMTYQVSWVGNDGTFSSAKTITLKRGSAVKFRVTVNARTAGVHSALLKLDSPLSSGVEYQTLNTVVAAEEFTAANSYTIKHGGDVGRNQFESYFVRVPAGTPALKVDIEGGGTTPGAGQIRFLRYHPYGVSVDVTSTPNCYNPPVPPGNACPSGDPRSRTYPAPEAGVWEIVVEARRTSDTMSAPYTVTIAAVGATVAPNPDVVESVQLNVPTAREYELTAALGAFNGRATGTNLGSGAVGEKTIADGAVQEYEIQVAPGSSQLRVKIGNTSDVAADLDLFLLNCTSGTCVAAGQSADTDSEEAVSIANPAAGRWVARVDGYAVPEGETTYDYLDVFTAPSFGRIDVVDSNQPRASGSTWTVTGNIIAQTAPGAGRVLLGNIEVRSDTNALVGSGDVIINSVS